MQEFLMKDKDGIFYELKESTMKKVKYGYISPIKYQHLIPESADFHLILAHLLDNREYVDFYKEKIKRGDTVILDNSAFEFKRALSAEEIFGFIERSGIEPTYVVDGYVDEAYYSEFIYLSSIKAKAISGSTQLEYFVAST